MNAVGIDIGKSAIHIGTARGDNPKKYPVRALELEAGWEEALAAALPPYAVVCFEPTGWNYSHPIAEAISNRRPDCQLWQVEHSATKYTREKHISSNKTDKTDAQALAILALEVSEKPSKPPRRVKRYDHARQTEVLALRLTVNHASRATRDMTRATNRYRQAVHAINPILADKESYANAVDLDIITPDELMQFTQNPNKPIKHQTLAALKNLISAIDITPVHPQVRQAVKRAREMMNILEPIEDQAKLAVEQALEHPYYKERARRLLTIPDARPLWVAAVLVATEGAENADQFKAALGAYPQRTQSGDSDESQSSKKGYRPAMNALHMWAMSLTNQKSTKNKNNPIMNYFGGGTKEGGRKFTATKAKLARIMWGVINSEEGYHVR